MSLALYIVVYLIMFPTGIAFMAGLVRRGPQDEVPAGSRRKRIAEPALRKRRTRGPRLTIAEGAMVLDLVPLWTMLLGLAVFYYVVFDGFDLGVGMLYGFMPSEPSRDIAMNSIAPIWDGNETWLVFGGIGLLAAFPLAFAIIIPAVYFPILMMLLALVFRGVAFEFRFKHPSVAAVLGWGFLRRLNAGDLRARSRSWRLYPGLQGRRAAILPALHSTGSVHFRSRSDWR